MALLIGGTLALMFLELPSALLVIAVLVGVEIVEFRIWRWALRQRPRGGTEGTVGEVGVLTEDRRVRIHGTSYSARILEGDPGDRVVVESVEGMTLVVRRAPER